MIRTGLHKTLDELRDATETAQAAVQELTTESTPAAFERAADAIAAAHAMARGLATPPNITGCDEHPQGAVEPAPPEGWSRCLICNTRRRRAQRGLNR